MIPTQPDALKQYICDLTPAQITALRLAFYHNRLMPTANRTIIVSVLLLIGVLWSRELFNAQGFDGITLCIALIALMLIISIIYVIARPRIMGFIGLRVAITIACAFLAYAILQQSTSTTNVISSLYFTFLTLLAGRGIFTVYRAVSYYALVTPSAESLRFYRALYDAVSGTITAYDMAIADATFVKLKIRKNDWEGLISGDRLVIVSQRRKSIFIYDRSELSFYPIDGMNITTMRRDMPFKGKIETVYAPGNAPTRVAAAADVQINALFAERMAKWRAAGTVSDTVQPAKSLPAL